MSKNEENGIPFSHENIPTYEEVVEAAGRIRAHIHNTPVFTCSYLDKLAQRKLHFKCEQFQKTGSFKVRGAVNALLKLKETDPNCNGAITHSSGNHAQAMAYASGISGIPVTVVVPNNCPQSKQQAIRGYGAELYQCEPTCPARISTTAALAKERDLVIISSHAHRDVIAGQGTLAYELLEQVPNMDAIFVCTSGGGMAAGIAIVAKHINPNIKIFIVEPKGKELEKNLRAGKRLWHGGSGYLDTIADGIRVEPVGEPNFEVFLRYVEKDVYTVCDEEITDAMKMIWERMKLVVETAAAATVAAVLSDKAKNLPENIQNIGVILCGGNVDLMKLPWLSKQ